jgi:hypothetical protein
VAVASDTERHRESVKRWAAANGYTDPSAIANAFTRDRNMMLAAGLAVSVNGAEPGSRVVLAWLDGDPPPKAPTHPVNSLWDRVVRELQKRPGTWADLGVHNNSRAFGLRRRGCEVARRQVHQGVVRLYARWPAS